MWGKLYFQVMTRFEIKNLFWMNLELNEKIFLLENIQYLCKRYFIWCDILIIRIKQRYSFLMKLRECISKDYFFSALSCSLIVFIFFHAFWTWKMKNNFIFHLLYTLLVDRNENFQSMSLEFYSKRLFIIISLYSIIIF